MVELKRMLRIVTHQEVTDEPPVQEGFPMRVWNVKLYLLDENGEAKPATPFTKVVYHLHPSFEEPVQTYTKMPFTCANPGWGEFAMKIDLYTTERGGKNTVDHDLNFLAEDYDNDIEIKFKNPSSALIALLRETGPVPGDENGTKEKVDVEKKRKRDTGDENGITKKADGDKKRKRGDGSVDMEKLAENLVKLSEEDLLHVVQLIHDNKTPETYTKNDIEQGEFHVDLYTLSESLLKMLCDFVQQKV